MSEHSWPSEWLRGVLTLAVMRVLADGPTYGYAIIARLEEQRFGRFKGGTLYPLLGRLEQAGHVTVDWRAGDGGPGRKYFALTPEGERALQSGAELWASFSAHATAFIWRDATGTEQGCQAQRTTKENLPNLDSTETPS